MGVIETSAHLTRSEAATNQVRYALEQGRLTRPSTCERCGGEGRIEAHHEDYTRPLVVQWLCKPCHAKADVARRERGPLPHEKEVLEVDRELLHVKEAAAIVKAHPNTIRRAIASGELPAVRLGAHGRYRVTRTDVERFLRPVKAGS